MNSPRAITPLHVAAVAGLGCLVVLPFVTPAYFLHIVIQRGR
jgi:hypothetical protein